MMPDHFAASFATVGTNLLGNSERMVAYLDCGRKDIATETCVKRTVSLYKII